MRIDGDVKIELDGWEVVEALAAAINDGRPYGHDATLVHGSDIMHALERMLGQK